MSNIKLTDNSGGVAIFLPLRCSLVMGAGSVMDKDGRRR